MTTLIGILDVLVLLYFLFQITRVVSKGAGQGSGPMILAVVIALALAIFGLVSFIANVELVSTVSSLWQVVVLLALLVMAGLAQASSKPIA